MQIRRSALAYRQTPMFATGRRNCGVETKVQNMSKAASKLLDPFAVSVFRFGTPIVSDYELRQRNEFFPCARSSLGRWVPRQ